MSTIKQDLAYATLIVVVVLAVTGGVVLGAVLGNAPLFVPGLENPPDATEMPAFLRWLHAAS